VGGSPRSQASLLVPGSDWASDWASGTDASGVRCLRSAAKHPPPASHVPGATRRTCVCPWHLPVRSTDRVLAA